MKNHLFCIFGLQVYREVWQCFDTLMLCLFCYYDNDKHCIAGLLSLWTVERLTLAIHTSSQAAGCNVSKYEKSIWGKLIGREIDVFRGKQMLCKIQHFMEINICTGNGNRSILAAFLSFSPFQRTWVFTAEYLVTVTHPENQSFERIDSRFVKFWSIVRYHSKWVRLKVCLVCSSVPNKIFSSA